MCSSHLPLSLSLSLFLSPLARSRSTVMWSRETAEAADKKAKEEEVEEEEPESAIKMPGCILFFKGCGEKTNREDIKVDSEFIVNARVLL